MIEPVTPVPSAGADAGQWENPQAQPPAADEADTTGRLASTPKPLSIEVARGADGVFVYTLTDPGTGTVLAVIPREDVQLRRDGRNLDQRV